MSKGRLTRQELGWLLTQEAQGAAERLRVGVQVLKTNPPPSEPGNAGLDATLDALDDTMKMLHSLHHRPVRVMGRRGRVDLAALLWEIAPEARVSIEPGSGTEVFGDEAELRRMLQLLVGHGSGVESLITIRRDGDSVRIGVVLGPDSTATAQVERAWLERMAIRYGGSLELEGGMEIVNLPADSERTERQALEKELDEARKQGEAYARELAATFSPTEEAVTPSTFPPALSGGDVADRVAVLTRFSSGLAAALRSQLGPAMHKLEPEAWLEQARRSLSSMHELGSTLASIGEVDAQELPGPVPLGDVISLAVGGLRPRADRAGVAILVESEVGREAYARGTPRGISLLVEQLLAHAISASPRGSEIRVRVRRAVTAPARPDAPPAYRLDVEDRGPALPSTARKSFVELELEPGTYGRPSALPLYVAAALASWQGAGFEVGDAEGGGLRVGVTFAR